MSFIDRIGIDVGRKLGIEDAIAWAARHGVKAIDVQTDIVPNTLECFDEAHCTRVLEACATIGVSITLHTLSGVKFAEISPILRDTTDQYLLRKEAAIARLDTAKIAESAYVQPLLKNLNGERERAEVHYVPDTLTQAQDFPRQIASPNLHNGLYEIHMHPGTGNVSFVECSA